MVAVPLPEPFEPPAAPPVAEASVLLPEPVALAPAPPADERTERALPVALALPEPAEASAPETES